MAAKPQGAECIVPNGVGLRTCLDCNDLTTESNSDVLSLPVMASCRIPPVFRTGPMSLTLLVGGLSSEGSGYGSWWG